MKILITDSVKHGIKNAIGKLNYNGVIWTPAIKPAFDAFAEFEPDVLIMTKKDESRAISKCIANRPSLKVLCFEQQPELLDDVIFYPVEPEEKFKCDFAFYNEGPGNEHLLKLCYPLGKYNFRIYGQKLGLQPHYCGQLQPHELRSLFCSANTILTTPNTSKDLHYGILATCGWPLEIKTDDPVCDFADVNQKPVSEIDPEETLTYSEYLQKELSNVKV